VLSRGFELAARRRAALGTGSALLLLSTLVAVTVAAPSRTALIGYYGLAPLVAALGAGPFLTGCLGVLAAAGAVAAQQSTETSPATEDLLLRTGVVVACSVVAVALSAARSRRDRRLTEVNAVAEVTQRSILDTSTITLPGLDLATAYRSATARATVGGDFVEGIHGPFGTRLIVGDVRGKGLPAVRLAATVLGAFRLAAISRPSLEGLAADLDSAVSMFGNDEDFATALLVEVEPDALRIVSCGHPLPLTGPAGRLHQVPARVSRPLGMGGARHADEIHWPQGHLLLAYTDGLLEARDRKGRTLQVVQIVARVDGGRPAEAVEQVASKLMEHTRGRLADDVAVLAAARSGPGSVSSTTETVAFRRARRLYGRRRVAASPPASSLQPA
jgi:sigma-B regulation protein RsbU (phosphoserine phosphatase)